MKGAARANSASLLHAGIVAHSGSWAAAFTARVELNEASINNAVGEERLLNRILPYAIGIPIADRTRAAERDRCEFCPFAVCTRHSTRHMDAQHITTAGHTPYVPELAAKAA